MKTKNLISMFMLILAMLACNLPAAQPTAQPPTETVASPTEAPPTVTPSQTPIPTDTPLPTPTATPTIPIAWPSDRGVNCRFGPSTQWLVVGALLVGQTATIQGKNADSSWWFVETPNDRGKPCWVAASVTNVAGNVGALPILSSPDASVIGLKINVEPDTRSVAGCLGPIQPVLLRGKIEVNGPTTVKWYFETQQGGAMSTQTTNFINAEEKEVSADYTPLLTAGTYWARLVVTTPNDKTAEAKYKIECP